MTPAEADTSLAKVKTFAKAPVEVVEPFAKVNALAAAPAEVMGVARESEG